MRYCSKIWMKPMRPLYLLFCSLLLSIIGSLVVGSSALASGALQVTSTPTVRAVPSMWAMSTPGGFSCPTGLPSGFGTLTPDPGWLASCGHCLPSSTPLPTLFLPSATPGVGTPSVTPGFTSTPTLSVSPTPNYLISCHPYQPSGVSCSPTAGGVRFTFNKSLRGFDGQLGVADYVHPYGQTDLYTSYNFVFTNNNPWNDGPYNGSHYLEILYGYTTSTTQYTLPNFNPYTFTYSTGGSYHSFTAPPTASMLDVRMTNSIQYQHYFDSTLSGHVDIVGYPVAPTPTPSPTASVPGVCGVINGGDSGFSFDPGQVYYSKCFGLLGPARVIDLFPLQFQDLLSTIFAEYSEFLEAQETMLCFHLTTSTVKVFGQTFGLYLVMNLLLAMAIVRALTRNRGLVK